MKKDKKLQSNLEWDVKVQPLFTINDNYTNRKAIMRNDDNRILGVVGEKYKAFTNRELQKLCKAIEKIGKFKTEGFSELKNGKIVMAFIRNHSTGLKIAGLDLDEYLVIGNSHDGSRQLFIGTSQTLIRCENQFYSNVPLMRAKHVHGLSVQTSFVNKVKESYEIGRKTLYKAMETLPSKTISQKLVDDLIIYLLNTDSQLPSDDRKREILNSSSALNLRQCIGKETNDLGKNAFGLFNGVTWYTSHELRQPNNNFGNASGAAQQLNAKALEFCLSL